MYHQAVIGRLQVLERVGLFFSNIELYGFDSSAKSSDFFTGNLIPRYPSEFNTLISVYESGLYPRLVCFQESEKRQRLGISV